jgi:hypothetical protein
LGETINPDRSYTPPPNELQLTVRAVIIGYAFLPVLRPPRPVDLGKQFFGGG